MKIVFSDKSYVETSKSTNPDKIFITVAAKSAEDPNKLIANCVELTSEQLLALVRAVS